MSDPNRSLMELLDEMGGPNVELRRSAGGVSVALVAMTRDLKILIAERTYRDGVCCIVEPTSEEIQSAESGDPWKIWNSERAVPMSSVV